MGNDWFYTSPVIGIELCYMRLDLHDFDSNHFDLDYSWCWMPPRPYVMIRYLPNTKSWIFIKTRIEGQGGKYLKFRSLAVIIAVVMAVVTAKVIAFVTAMGMTMGTALRMAIGTVIVTCLRTERP